MDNAPLQQVAGVGEAIGRKCELALSPAYSPDFNPIESLLQVQVDPATHRGAAPPMRWRRRSASAAKRHAR